METINGRLKHLRISLNYSQEEFGKILGITRSGVSNIESGVRKVNDKHIKFLTDTLNVSETWLRTGDGDMLAELSRNEAIAAWAAKILRDDPENDFIRYFVEILSKLDTSDWKTLEKIANMLADAKKKD